MCIWNSFRISPFQIFWQINRFWVRTISWIFIFLICMLTVLIFNFYCSFRILFISSPSLKCCVNFRYRIVFYLVVKVADLVCKLQLFHFSRLRFVTGIFKFNSYYLYLFFVTTYCYATYFSNNLRNKAFFWIVFTCSAN